jgi:4,5-DOPA dioxygenase extradiol
MHPMNRKSFIQTVAFASMTPGSSMKLNQLNQLINPFEETDQMPVFFFGHGSPMNAIEENEFVKGFREAGKTIPTPKAILCISAHWETKGTFITAMEKPPTIHDFGGFPQALFDVQYPAPGSPTLAKETQSLIKKTGVMLDDKWGLDHGCWSVLKHIYPSATVPVIQLSIDYTKPPAYHFELAQSLATLRKKGVLIIGSGNMVHNLRLIAWDKFNEQDYAYDWAAEASYKMKQYILSGHYQPLIDFKAQGKSFDLAIPTPEHYLPLLYTLALKEANEKISLFNDKAVAGSLTMTSVKIEKA